MLSDRNMEEERYNNRQIERMLDEQSTDLKSYIDLALEPLIVQTTKTNGMVGKHHWYIAMAIGGLAILSITVLPIMGWSLLQIVTIEQNIHAQVTQAVSQALDNYVIKQSN